MCLFINKIIDTIIYLICVEICFHLSYKKHSQFETSFSIFMSIACRLLRFIFNSSTPRDFIWAIAGILLIGPLGTNFSEILIRI